MTRFKDKPKKAMEPNTVAYCIDVPDRWTLTKRTNDWMDKQCTTDMRRGYRNRLHCNDTIVMGQTLRYREF